MLNKIELIRKDKESIKLKVNGTEITNIEKFSIDKQAGELMCLSIKIAIDESQSTIAL